MKLKNILGLLIFSAVLCAVAPAKADRIDDMDKQGPEAYCMEEAGLVVAGAVARNLDVAKVVKPIDQDMRAKMFLAMEGGDPFVFPKDGIYYDALDLNEREVAFFTEYAFLGWDMVDQVISDGKKRHPDATSVVIDPAQITNFGTLHFNTCMKRRVEKSKEKEASGTGTGSPITKVASNESLYRHSPNTPQAEYCTDISVRRFNECMSGHLVK